MDDEPDDVEVGQMMNHLIESKGRPVRSSPRIIKTAQKFWSSFDSVHDEVNDEIENRQVPEGWFHGEHDHEGHNGVNRAVERQGPDKIPTRGVFAKHERELQREVGNEMLQLKCDQQNEDKFNFVRQVDAFAHVANHFLFTESRMTSSHQILTNVVEGFVAALQSISHFSRRIRPLR